MAPVFYGYINGSHLLVILLRFQV